MSGKVLVADDDLANRELLKEVLELHGHQVVTASDGEQALAQFAHAAPDLVLTDVMMPKIDGFEVCRRLKSNPETQFTPVVLVTALNEKQERLRGIEAGADDFLNKPIDQTELLARARSLLKLKARTDELERAESVVFALAKSIEGKDPCTAGHCDRLSDLSTALGRRLRLPEEQIVALRRAGVIHDVGKVAVPDSILVKPGPLTEDEWKVMREHPVVGERICAPLKSFRLVLPIIRHHHEKFDGSGYPDGLRGEAIPLTARILSLVDVYDALTTERSYKPALPVTEALEIMEQEVAKGWWDPHLFAEFRETLLQDDRAGLKMSSQLLKVARIEGDGSNGF